MPRKEVMNEPKQGELFEQQPQPTRKRPNTIYYPPKDDLIVQYAQRVCRGLAERLDPSYDSMEMRRELGDFFKIVGRMYAKQLNTEQEQGAG
jgi:hypothetical protein